MTEFKKVEVFTRSFRKMEEVSCDSYQTLKYLIFETNLYHINGENVISFREIEE